MSDGAKALRDLTYEILEEPEAGSDNTSNRNKILLLPNELLWNVVHRLPRASVNSLAQTCQRINGVCNPFIYRQHCGYALPWAVVCGRADTAERTFEYTNDNNGMYHFDPSLLAMAARMRHLDVVTVLIRKGANVNHRDKSGFTALAEALKTDNVETAMFLLQQNGIDTTDEANGIPLFEEAIEHGTYAIIDQLLQSKEYVDAHINTVFKNGQTPLSTAAEYDSDDIFELLVSRGADVNQKDTLGQTQLAVAIMHSQFKPIERFLQQKDIDLTDEMNRIPMFEMAIRRNAYAVVQRLLQCKEYCDAHINALFETGESPLGVAGRYGFDGILELLVDSGADIHQQNGYGITAMAETIFGGESSSISLLLRQNGIDLTDKINGIPMFEMAVTSGVYEVVDRLLQCKETRDAHINTVFKSGRTPLDFAVRHGYTEIAKLLIRNGADVNQQTDVEDHIEDGLTVLNIDARYDQLFEMRQHQCELSSRRHFPWRYVPRFSD